MINHFDMELTQRQAQEYKKATKKKKGEILSRYSKLTGVKRDTARKRFKKVIRGFKPRVLSQAKRDKDRKRGPKVKYTSIHKGIIKKAWELSGEVCAERLHPVVGELINQLERNNQLKYYGRRYILESKDISEVTLKRIITEFPKINGRKKSKGKADIYKQIPIQAYFGENANKPGYVEVDYVEHSGGSSSGVFAVTGSYVDVFSQWLTRAAGLGKSLKSVSGIHEKNQKKIYHQIHEYHPDNDKPTLKLLLGKRLNPDGEPSYRLSRSRPYHKEDNGHVEQKNGDKVRKLVGYHRYDTGGEVELLNKLYDIEDLISNFFIPSQKLVEKVKDERGRVVKKRYDKAKTAYQRLMGSRGIDKETKEKLESTYQRLNLVELREESEEIKKEIGQVVSRKINMI